jgi:hypothetical protein
VTSAYNDGEHRGNDSLGPALPPVVAVCFNRPSMARNLVSVLRRVRPHHILIVADGPRQDHDSDRAAVAATRAEFESIDWPCRIDRLFSDVNLGCTKRIVTGLNWAFGMVEAAVILEDDIDATPQFFTWAKRMLELYSDRDDIAMLSGHNPLINWPEFSRGSSAIPSRRGAISGWATWARAWNSAKSWSIEGNLSEVEEDISRCEFEPALSSVYQLYLAEARGRPLSWDDDFTLRMAMSGRRCLVSPTNFIHHLGVGPDATHHVDSDDTLFFLPRPERHIPNTLMELPVGSVDRKFDRARVLLELLVRAKNPHMARRLAARTELPIENNMKTHLLPFVFSDETLALLKHLEREGLDHARSGYWIKAVRGA